MKVLVFTPDHVFKTDQEKLIGGLRAGFKEEGLKGISLVSARTDVETHGWDDLTETLVLDGHYWDAVLIPLNPGADARGDTDLEQFQKLAKRLPKKNVVAYLDGDARAYMSMVKQMLVGAGILFIHDGRDGPTMLHNWLVAAAGAPVIKSIEPIVAGALKIDLVAQRVTLDNIAVKIPGNEYRLLEQLALNQGQVRSAEDLLEALDDDLSISAVLYTISALRRRLQGHDLKAGRDLIRNGKHGGWYLADNAMLEHEQAASPAKICDYGWFKVHINSLDEGVIAGSEVKLSPREILIVDYLHTHPGEYLLPAAIAKALYPDGSVGGIAIGQGLTQIRRKVASVDPAFSACTSEKLIRGYNHVMFLPQGTTLETVNKVRDQRDTKNVNLGWITLEVSPRFNPKRTRMTPMRERPGARVADTEIILSPQETAAIIYAHKNHGQWLVGRLLKQADLPKVLKKTQFWTHMNSAFAKLSAGGLKPEQFIQLHGKTYVRFLRKGETYPKSSDVPLQAPRSVADDVRETLNAGGWMTLEVRSNGTGVIAENNRALSQPLTAIFKYAIQHPEEIITVATAPKIFPQGISEQWFYACVTKLKKILAGDGFEDVFYASRNEGATFFPRSTVEAHSFKLHSYFKILSQRAKAERQNPGREIEFVGPVQPYGPSIRAH